MDRTKRIITMALSKADQARMRKLESKLPAFENTDVSQKYIGKYPKLSSLTDIFDVKADHHGTNSAICDRFQLKFLEQSSNLAMEAIPSTSSVSSNNLFPALTQNWESIQNNEISSSSRNEGSRRRSKRLSKKVKRNLFKEDSDSVEQEDPFLDSGSEYMPSENSEEQNDYVPTTGKPISRHKCTNLNPISPENLVTEFGLSDGENSKTERQFLTEQSTATSTRHKSSEELNILVNNDEPFSEDTSEGIVGSTLEFETVSSSEVGISMAKKVQGKLIRDKRHCCYFCEKLLTNNMARHFEVLHSKEMEVAKLLSFPKKSLLRREGFKKLINIGDFYYNSNALATKTGDLILIRPTYDKHLSYTDFGPCTKCLGFMAKKYLWHHMQRCQKSNGGESKTGKGPMAESAALLFGLVGPKFDREFVTQVVATIRSDEIGVLSKEDSLVMKVGEFIFEKTKKHVESTRQGIRQLTRLKMELNSRLDQSEKKKSLTEWIVPKYFDNVIAATKSLSKEQEELGQKVPSLALKIGQLLRMCIKVETGIAIRNSLYQRRKELREFEELMDIEWSSRVSSKALSTLSLRKINSTQLLPLTSDLMKLNSHLHRQMDIYKGHVSTNCTRQSWNSLASSTLSRIILFNKRRSGEAAKMTLQDYANRPSWAEQGTEEFKNSLSKFELDLANKLTVVEIVGKRGRKVPVLLTADMKSCIDLLIKMRSEGNISPTNPFIFARSFSSSFALRGHDCLRNACSEAGLVSAENINSTKLRKYIATVCQIFDLKENECDWLAKHLGHDIRVHREFYRMHESAAELTKVSRLLIAVDNGEAQKFSGKKLSEINIEDLPALEIEEEQ